MIFLDISLRILKETYNQEAMQSLTYEEFEQVTSMAKLLKSSGLQNADGSD